MAHSLPLLRRLRPCLAAYRWRRVGVLAAVSLALSLSLIGYLFGGSDRFAERAALAFVVWFCLLAVTFLVAIPFIGWAATHWFGRGWAGPAVEGPARRRAAPAGVRRSTSTLP